MTTTAENATRAERPLTGWRSDVDRIYGYLAGVFALAVVAQVFLAGIGTFGDHNRQIADATSFDPHRAFGEILGGVAVLLFLVTLAARAAKATMIGAFVLALLTQVAQPVFASAADHGDWVGGLHALDGVFILLLSIWLAGSAHRRGASRRRSPTTSPS